MSHRMACERSDLVRGIVSFNGSSFTNPADCDPDHPVDIIHIHATDDDIVPYDGNAWLPSARDVVDRWADWNGCDSDPVEAGRIDLTHTVDNEETVIETWQNCAEGGDVQLWTMEGAAHVPYPLNDFGPTIFDVLLAD
jgi:polyhydroxybutyrate depolymerase